MHKLKFKCAAPNEELAEMQHLEASLLLGDSLPRCERSTGSEPGPELRVRSTSKPKIDGCRRKVYCPHRPETQRLKKWAHEDMHEAIVADINFFSL